MDLSNISIGEIVKTNYKTSDIFKKYGIDFCCGGGKSIARVCKESNLDEEEIIREVKKMLQTTKDDGLRYDEWPIDLLATYVPKIHHKYVEENIPVLKEYLAKIAKVHGKHHPELHEIKALFDECADDLTMHMKKEELMLFPYIQKLAKLQESPGTPWQQPVFGSIKNPIDQMEEEHTTEGDRFRSIVELSNNYTPPADACNTYIVAFQKLREFEADLNLHIHLENNILFPKAIALEKALLSNME